MREQRSVIPAVIMVAGIILSVALFVVMERAEIARFRARFSAGAQKHSALLENNLRADLVAVHSLAAFFEHSQLVTRDEFQLFTSHLLADNSSLLVLGWIPRVPAAERDHWEAQARGDGLAGFRFTERDPAGRLVPAAARPEYFPVYYARPLAPSAPARGYDLGSDPARRAAIARAIATGRPAVTERITLLQDGDERFGFLLLIPVFRTETDTSPGQVAGFALGVFPLDRMAAQVFDPVVQSGVNIWIDDPAAPPGKQSLIRFGSGERAAAAAGCPCFSLGDGELIVRSRLQVADREWQVTCSPGPNFRDAADGLPAQLALFGGLLLTLMLMLLTVHRERNFQRISRLTSTLEAVAAINHMIVTVRDRDRLLGEACRILLDKRRYRLVTIELIEEAGTVKLVPVAWAGHEDGFFDAIRAAGSTPSLDDGPAGSALRTRRPEIRNHIARDPAYPEPFRSAALRRGYAAHAVLPLVFGDQALGAICVFADRSHAFDTEEIELLAQMAGDLAFALNSFAQEAELARNLIRRQELELELRENADLQTALNRVLRLALETVSLEELLSQVVDAVLGIPWLSLEGRGAIFLVEGEPPALVMKAQRGFVETLLRQCALVPLGRCHCGRAAAENKTQYAARVDERHETTYDGIVPHGHYCVPIAFGTEVLGVLNVDIPENHPYSLREEGFLTTVANTVAGIVHHYRGEAQLNKLTEVVRQSGEAIVITDAEGKIEYVNPAFEQLTGYAAAEALGRTPQLLKSGRQNDETYRQLWRTLTAGKSFRGEFINRKKSGEEYTEEKLITPILDRQGTIAHFAGMGRNITGRKLLEEQYRQAQKMEVVGRLAGGIAHDFNNLLTVMLVRAQFIQEAATGNPQVAEDVNELLATVDQATRLTGQLLAFSRREMVRPEPLDLNLTVKGMLSVLKRLIGEDIRVEFRAAPEPAVIRTDRSQCEQVLTNLVVNARDAMPAGGRLTITVGLSTLRAELLHRHGRIKPGEYVVLTVTDTGQGIPASVIEHIFEPFFTTKSSGKGTGLGLATVYGIVHQHNGGIACETMLGKSTTFTVYFPRLVNPESAPGRQPATAASVAARGKTIMVVEDNVGVLSVAERILSRAGFTVLAADDPALARKTAEEHPFPIDLLFTDMVMPGMNGRQLAEAIVKQRPETKVLFTSGYTDDFVTRYGVELSEIEFIPKPYLPEALLEKVNRVLA